MDIAGDLKAAGREMPPWGWYVLGLGGLILLVLHFRKKSAPTTATPSGAPSDALGAIQQGSGASGSTVATAGSVLSAIDVLQIEQGTYSAQFTQQSNAITALQQQIAQLLAGMQAGGGHGQKPPHPLPPPGGGGTGFINNPPPPRRLPPVTIPIDSPPTSLPPVHVTPMPPPGPVSPFDGGVFPAMQGSIYGTRLPYQAFGFAQAAGDGGINYSLAPYQILSGPGIDYGNQADVQSYFDSIYAKHPSTVSPELMAQNLPVRNTSTPAFSAPAPSGSGLKR